MILLPKRCIAILCCLSFLVSISPNIFSQQVEEFPTEVPVEVRQPPMKNIFYNVLWGSISGGTLMMSWSVIDDSKPKEERQKFSELTGKFLEGATYGGVLGLIAGVYLSMQNITFDENKTRIAFFNSPSVELNNATASAPLIPDQFNLIYLEIQF